MTVQPNHKFVVVSKDGDYAHYSSCHFKRAMNWIQENQKDNFQYEIMEADAYRARQNEDIEVTHLMTGKPVIIKRSHRGTVCDPYMECYFTF